MCPEQRCQKLHDLSKLLVTYLEEVTVVKDLDSHETRNMIVRMAKEELNDPMWNSVQQTWGKNDQQWGE